MYRTKDMRGRTPLLLLLLLLLAAFSTSVLCQIDEAGPEEEVQPEEEGGEGEAGESEIAETTFPPESSTTIQTETELTDLYENPVGEGSGGEVDSSDSEAVDPDSTASPVEEEGLDITIILIPVVLVFLIIAMIAVGLYISRRWNSKARENKDSKLDDTYMDASTSEKVPMPMFEEDVPSVLELEMEELDQWITKDS